MAYTAHEFKSGEKLYAAQLNEMDAQIEKNAESVTSLSEEIAKLNGQIVTKTGNVLVVDENAGTNIEISSDESEPGVLIHQGKNFCPGGRISNPNFEGNGVTITPNEDGTLRIVGTTIATTFYYFTRQTDDIKMILPAGEYVQSVKLVSGSAPGASVTLCSEKELEDGTAVQNSLPLTNLLTGKSVFTLTERSRVRSFLVISAGATLDCVLSVQYELGVTPSNYEPFIQNQYDLPATIDALAGANVLYTTNGDTITARYRKSSVDGVHAWGLPVLHLNGSTSGMTKDNAVDLAYVYGNLSGTASVKWQGSSSLSYPKKNYTIKFDQAFEAKKGWGVHDKYCLKADWVDPTHIRNRVSAILWRNTYQYMNPSDEHLGACPNYGAIDGFPCIITLNDEFYGLYSFNIPKDGWMLNFPSEGATKECILCANGKAHNSAEGFKALEPAFGNGFDVEYITDENDTGWALDSLNTMISACMASDGSDLDTTLAAHIDWVNVSCYVAFTIATCNYDGIIKNYLLYTRDGVKWRIGAYDLDCLFGNLYNGKEILPAKYQNVQEMIAQHKLFELLVNFKKQHFKAVYNSLRNSVLSEDAVATLVANKMGEIPEEIYAMERQRWPELYMTSVNGLAQITDWYRRRVALADKWIEAL